LRNFAELAEISGNDAHECAMVPGDLPNLAKTFPHHSA